MPTVETFGQRNLSFELLQQFRFLAKVETIACLNTFTALMFTLLSSIKLWGQGKQKTEWRATKVDKQIRPREEKTEKLMYGQESWRKERLENIFPRHIELSWVLNKGQDDG
jgi:hypothetical protein